MKPAFTLNGGKNFKMRVKIFVQANFCECKSIDQILNPNLPVFLLCEILQSTHLIINQFILCENKIKQSCFPWCLYKAVM